MAAAAAVPILKAVLPALLGRKKKDEDEDEENQRRRTQRAALNGMAQKGASQ